MHGRARVGLGEHEHPRLARLGAHLRRQRRERPRQPLVRAQDAQPGARSRHERVDATAVAAVGRLDHEVVLAVAQERELVEGQPAHELPGLGDLGVRQRRRVGGDLLGAAQGGVAQLGPVLDRLAHVRQHAAQPVGEPVELGGVGLPVDLDVDPRLDHHVGQRAVAVLRRLVRKHFDHRARQVASHDQLGVDDQVDRGAALPEVGGDRVDQERHVVGDHLDDGVAGGPAVLVHGRGVDPHVGAALGAYLRELAVGERGAQDVDRVATDDVLGRDVLEVALQVLRVRLDVPRSTLVRRLDGLGDQLRLGLLQAGGRDADGRAHGSIAFFTGLPRSRPYALVRLSCRAYRSGCGTGPISPCGDSGTRSAGRRSP